MNFRWFMAILGQFSRLADLTPPHQQLLIATPKGEYDQSHAAKRETATVLPKSVDFAGNNLACRKSWVHTTGDSRIFEKILENADRRWPLDHARTPRPRANRNATKHMDLPPFGHAVYQCQGWAANTMISRKIMPFLRGASDHPLAKCQSILHDGVAVT